METEGLEKKKKVEETKERMSSPTQISLSKVMLLFSSIVVGVVVAMDSNSDASTRVRTSSAAARVSEDDDVVRMTMDEFICGPCKRLDLEKTFVEEDIEDIVRRQMEEADIDPSGIPRSEKFWDFDRSRAYNLRDTMTSEETAKEALEDGAITQKEYDDFIDMLERLSELEDSSSGDERGFTPFKASNGRDFVIPTRKKLQEQPLSEEIRHDSIWEKSVERDWCKTKGSDISAIGLSPEQTKCAVCQNYYYLTILGEIEGIREIADEVRVLSLRLYYLKLSTHTHILTHRSNLKSTSWVWYVCQKIRL
jgi:hypothetical protein